MSGADLRLFVVNTFVTDRPFSGNPAGVVPLESWPSDGAMQGMAAQHNLSETAFFVRDAGAHDLFHLRWFTPASEIDLCGHATLASGHVVLRELKSASGRVRFMTRSGELTVEEDGSRLRLDLPAIAPSQVDQVEAASGALGERPVETLGPGWLVAVYERAEQVRGLRPDMARVFEAHRHGVIATAPGSGHDFVARVFVPRFGIDEDPVTGSAFCALVPYWSARLGRTALSAHQASARGGDLACELRDGGRRVALAGRAATYLRGQITL